MANSKISWLSYIGLIQQQSAVPGQLKMEGLERMLNMSDIANSVLGYSIPWIYLLDYTTGRYLMISKSIKMMLGYDQELFMNEGLGCTLENYQADHLKLFSEEIFPDRLELLKQLPVTEHPNYIFTYNFRFRTAEGEYLNLLQRNCFVKSDENGNPLMSFGVITNVNHYTPENPIIQVVEKLGNDPLKTHPELIFKKMYYLNKEDGLLTKREKELLKWIAEGLTSKEIADKLFISEYTVINHRRNMMEKCNARNVPQLIATAITRHLI